MQFLPKSPFLKFSDALHTTGRTPWDASLPIQPVQMILHMRKVQKVFTQQKGNPRKDMVSA